LQRGLGHGVERDVPVANEDQRGQFHCQCRGQGRSEDGDAPTDGGGPRARRRGCTREAITAPPTTALPAITAAMRPWVPAPLGKVSTAMVGRVTGNSQARVPITAIMIRGLETLRASDTCGRIATRWRDARWRTRLAKLSRCGL